jgi:hypothetical protein
MSVDWNVVCDKCRYYRHLGQSMGGICSFGYGSNDSDGQKLVAEFISDHLYHNCADNESLRIMRTDCTPDDYINCD